MAGATKMVLSVDQLDSFGCCPEYLVVRELLLAADPDSARPFTIHEALAAGCRFASVRGLLFPVAQLAQRDLCVRSRLTGFVNDCVIRSLPAFEAAWPHDDRLRRMVEATVPLMEGGFAGRGWATCVGAGLSAWAALFAPEPTVANGTWAAVRDDRSHRCASFASWGDVNTRALAGWRGWAHWAVPAVMMHLLAEKSAGRSANGADPQWTVARLLAWLAPVAPEPLPVPDREKPRQSADAALAHAPQIDEFEACWNSIAIWPDGLRRINSIRWEGDTAIRLPAGLVGIGKIVVDDHQELVLPAGPTEIADILLCFDASLTVSEGVRSIGKIELWNGARLNLPATLRTIGHVVLDDESLELPLSVERVGQLEFDDDLEEDEESNCAMVRGNQRFTSAQQDLCFA